MDVATRGAEWCRAYSNRTDEWLRDVLAGALDGQSPTDLALVAVGGYGRSELCPQSDIDLMLVHSGRRDIGAVADRVWYPIWDAGLHLGHSVCTVKEAIEVAGDVLDTATALLSARLVAGDAELATRVLVAGRDYWQKHAKRLLTELGTRVELRHQNAGEVAFRLEPDLKEGRGGLRDVHSLHWVECAHRVMLDDDVAALDTAYNTLLDVRVELQRLTGRASNVLSLQDQDAVADALGLHDADELMHRVADAARAIAWTSDDTWRRVRTTLRGPLGRVGRRHTEVSIGTADASDPLVAVELAAKAAAAHTVLDRPTLERLAAETEAPPDPWPAELRTAFIALLANGRWATCVIEALDHRGIWSRLLPEWSPVRARPQRNPYHRFTVDRHLIEAVANATQRAGSVERTDLLLMGALLHDIGKGYPGDYSDGGAAIATGVAARMGFSDGDVETIAWLVTNHLLLADVAMRRDLDDPTTIDRVATAVGSVSRLELLTVLTEADSLATGPAAWSPGKAQLVGQLVDRVRAQLLGEVGDAAASAPDFPNARQRELLASGDRHLVADDDRLTVVAGDRPGVFSRVAGVLALHGLDVVNASAYSTEDGGALSEFAVIDRVRPEVPWPRVVADLELALDGRLALPARLAERAQTYGRARSTRALGGGITVRFDDDASTRATVIDVEAPDGIGVLYRITRALAELDLDIRSARVQTLGHAVIDSFYVRDRDGGLVADARLRGEIERALVHALTD